MNICEMLGVSENITLTELTTAYENEYARLNMAVISNADEDRLIDLKRRKLKEAYLAHKMAYHAQDIRAVDDAAYESYPSQEIKHYGGFGVLYLIASLMEKMNPALKQEGTIFGCTSTYDNLICCAGPIDGFLTFLLIPGFIFSVVSNVVQNHRTRRIIRINGIKSRLAYKEKEKQSLEKEYEPYQQMVEVLSLVHSQCLQTHEQMEDGMDCDILFDRMLQEYRYKMQDYERQIRECDQLIDSIKAEIRNV